MKQLELPDGFFSRVRHVILPSDNDDAINHIAIATYVGLILMDLDELVKGKATAGLAMKLGVTPTDIEDFIKGSATYGMTKRLGLASASAATELARVCGREGAIGIVMGLLFPGNA